MKIIVESENIDNEFISAFSYNTGKIIEKVIDEKTNNIMYENQILQAKILDFYHQISNLSIKEQYKNYFNIVVQ